MFTSLFLFVFDWSADPRHLHSFPTRRSSDLAGLGYLAGSLLLALAGRHPFRPSGRSLRSSTGRTERSEEHTSELQSRENLVCRLLLEKKKIIEPSDKP